jgi:bla regulator protein BlaR1
MGLAHHLWQSTLFAVMVYCLTLLLRKNGARIRCLMWQAASVKFLVPFALLTAVGAHIPWPFGANPGLKPGLLSIAVQKAAQITRFEWEFVATLRQLTHTGEYEEVVLILLGLLWGLGTLIVATRWYARWRLVRRVLRESTQTNLAFVVPVKSSSSLLEPAVVGILHPVLLLPEGLGRRLTTAELHAVLAHECCHVVWKDNLCAALHMLVEALFWFHPLVWWLGAHIVDERERACDEHVLADGNAPATYAEGILKVCEHYLESGLTCVAGIGDANLSRRIEDIMRNSEVEKTGVIRKVIISSAAFATFAVPVVIGVLTSPHALDQEKSVSNLYLGPIRAWELRSEVWLPMPDPAAQHQRP